MTNPITTLSRERLEYLSKVYGVTQPGSEEAEMARALLAVMDAKPFGYLFTGPAGLVVSPVYWSCEGLILQGPIWATPPAPSAPDGWATLPANLSADNGAKAALSGEFLEVKFISCPECFGDDECDSCDGSGRVKVEIPVSWTTIKAIWEKGVQHFSAAPAHRGK